MLVDLSPGELDLLVEALDSHEYWQLSDSNYRNNGYVLGDGADDEETVQEIAACRELHERLDPLRSAGNPPVERDDTAGHGTAPIDPW